LGKPRQSVASCPRCQVQRRWRRDGSCNVMFLDAALNNLAYQEGVCQGRSQDDGSPTLVQEQVLARHKKENPKDLLLALYRGEMLGTRSAEWWLVKCEECQRGSIAVEDAEDGLPALRA